MEKWECVRGLEKEERFMVAYILWTRLGDFITRKEKHKTDV
jgi:hypothetical protein